LIVESLYKFFLSFISKGVNTFLSILKILFQSRFDIKLPSAIGQTCIVVANGPSFKQSLERNPTFFREHPLICLNLLCISEEYIQLKPKYYVLLDPAFFSGEREDILNTFKCLEEKTTWQMDLIIPQLYIKSKNIIKLQERNHCVRIVVFNYTVYNGFDSIGFWFYRKNLAAPQCMNVAVAALFVALNIGYKELFVVGVDHLSHENLHMSSENKLFIKSTHFYRNEQDIKYVPFLKPNSSLTQKAHEFFHIWSKTFYGYIVLQKYSQYLKCKIFNASETSFIDAFERKKIV
jgi:hypothetical protein